MQRDGRTDRQADRQSCITLSSEEGFQGCTTAALPAPKYCSTTGQDPRPYMTEMTRIHLVLFAMNNRIFGPYLPAIDRIFISAML
jgi:hypothetical protein